MLGLALYGPFDMLAGLFSLLRMTFRLPLTPVIGTIGTDYALWGAWIGVKTLLAWGAIGYGVLLYRRHGRDWLRVALRGFGDRRIVATDRRQRLKDYYRDYAAAIRRGEEPPAPPAMLPAPGAVGASNYAQLSFWGLRIGLTLAGALGFYATFSDVLTGNLGAIFWRGLFGG